MNRAFGLLTKGKRCFLKYLVFKPHNGLMFSNRYFLYLWKTAGACISERISSAQHHPPTCCFPFLERKWMSVWDLCFFIPTMGHLHHSWKYHLTWQLFIKWESECASVLIQSCLCIYQGLLLRLTSSLQHWEGREGCQSSVLLPYSFQTAQKQPRPSL